MYFALRLLNPLSDVNNHLTSGVWHVKLTKGQKNYLKTQTNNENTSEFNDERLMYVTIYKHKSDESKSHWFLSASEYTNSTEITFELFCKVLSIDTSESYVLPEKWCVKVSNEQDTEEIQDYFNTGSVRSSTGYWYYCSNGEAKVEKERVPEGFTEITFEQFNKYVLKKNTMDKELIGYKLKDDFRDNETVIKAACTIEGYITFGELNICTKLLFTNNDEYSEKSLSKLKKAGVLDLWFEPVYKEQFQKGDWVIGDIGSTRYIGLYSSSDKMSEWMCINDENTSEEWFNNQGTFGSISRLATQEEIGIAKTYKYKAQIEAIVANAEAEIEQLLK